MYKIKYARVLFALMLAVAALSCGQEDTWGDDPYAKGADWTIMYYGDADNSLEPSMLSDIQEMKSGILDNQGYNVIVLMDRTDKFSRDTATFGEDFNDTRLYRIVSNNTVRIRGGDAFPYIKPESSYEANMGDADVLRRFIQFCKTAYPANKYALILSNHGGGARSAAGSGSTDAPSRNICVDDSSGSDSLYTAEISDVLSANESVHLLGMDACLMGNIEVAYQYRPGNGGFSAEVLVASPPNEAGYGWNYYSIFSRLRKGGGNNGKLDKVMKNGGGNEDYFDPASLTAPQLGGIIVEAQYYNTLNDTSCPAQALSSYDLSKVAALKTKIDALSSALAAVTTSRTKMEAIRGPLSAPLMLYYYDAGSTADMINAPYFDVYDLCKRVAAASTLFDASVTDKAQAAVNEFENGFVSYSFAMPTLGAKTSGGFINGKNGVSVFFPDGGEMNGATYYWKYIWWYNSIDTAAAFGPGNLYGKIAWCRDGATANNNTVENWYELLIKWNEGYGGVNGVGY